MTDTRLRELERRFHETGSVEDEAAWITERLRVGELSRERVELAAYCGHDASVAVLGGETPEVPEEPQWWVAGLRSWSDDLGVLVCSDLMRGVLSAGDRPTHQQLSRVQAMSLEQAALDLEASDLEGEMDGRLYSCAGSVNVAVRDPIYRQREIRVAMRELAAFLGDDDLLVEAARSLVLARLPAIEPRE